ncbi:hypothetical protein ACROYT_G007489 [Oculina patagonica]
MAYSQIVDLDSKDQYLTSNVWVRQFWINPRMAWNPSEYGGIKSINLNPELLWTPDIVLYNNINGGNSGEMYKFNTKIIVHHDGRHQWFAPTEIKSICSIDITFFPFDKQQCSLVFGSWTHTSRELELAKKGDTADLSKYTSNGQWKLVSLKAKKNVVKYSCCEDPFIDITFTLRVSRWPLFYVQNLIIPCVLLALLTVLSFCLPPDSGERIALVITMMLGLTVYMLIFTENVPHSSEVVPLISKFFLTVLLEVAVCLLATSFTLKIYHYDHPEREMPNCLRAFVFGFLAKIFRMSMRENGLGQNREGYDDVIKDGELPKVFRRYSNSMKYAPAKARRLSVASLNPNKLSFATDGIESRLEDISGGLNYLTDFIMDQKLTEAKKEHWKFAALVIDKFFLYLFAMMMCVSILAFYFMIPESNNFETE